MTLDKTIKTKIILFVLCVSGIILSFYLTSLFLRNNFYDDGEAYHKGAGHLLQENFGKGFAFISLRHLLISTLMFTIFFILVSKSSRRLTFKIFAIISTVAMILVLTYAGMKYIEVKNFHQTTEIMQFFNRTIEIVLTWTCRVLGFLLGYLITKRKILQPY